ncbi:MAG: homoserine O-acetyltransferase [Gammaproteobacteria bacterium]
MSTTQLPGIKNSANSNIIPLDAHAVPVSDATRIVTLPESFTLRGGDTLTNVQIAYETWGTLSAEKDNVVLIFTGLSPDAHAASSDQNPSSGWWEYMIGPGKPIDTHHFFVICVNSLGSCFGSTGPASRNPKTGEPYRLDFPDLAIEDIANTTRLALRELGIQHINTLVGPSLGGMSALAYAMEHAGEVDNLVLISAATHSTPFAIAIRSLQRELIRNDPAWKNGNYSMSHPPRDGMRMARKAGLISYRSPDEWLQRFGRHKIDKSKRSKEPFAPEFEIESYLEYNARKFVDHFDANCYLYLSRAMDWFDVAEHGGSIEAGLSKITCKRVLVIGVASDFLFPVSQQQEVADTLNQLGINTRLEILSSIQGHDAFLIDKDQFDPVMRSFFL